MSDVIRRAIRLSFAVGVVATILVAGVIAGVDGAPPMRPSLTKIQAQLDALQSRFDQRMPDLAAYAGANIFFLVPSISGDSTDGAHPGWIDAFAFGIGGEHSSGTPSFDEFVLIKQLDAATPGLLAAARDATPLGTVTVDVCSGSACPLRYQLTNANVRSIAPGPNEILTLDYTAIEVIFNAAGLGAPVTSGSLDVGGLGGLVAGFSVSGESFGVGSGNVDDIFVQFGSIQGDSGDFAHINWSDALAMSGGALSGPSVVAIGEFVILKAPDSATPLLMKALVEHDTLTTLKIDLCEANTIQDCFVTYEFSNAQLSRMISAGDREEIAFTFDQLTQTFHGSMGNQTFVFVGNP